MPQLLTPESDYLKGQFVGWAGNGKTSILASAADVPEMSPVLFLDAEGGLLSVKHRGDIYHERITSNQHFDQIIRKLAGHDKVYEEFRTIAVDSSTEAISKCLEEISEAEYKRYKLSLSSGNKRAERVSPDDVQLKDHGLLNRTMRRQMRWLKDLDNRNVFFSSLPQNVYPPLPTDEQAKARLEERIRKGLEKPWKVEPACPVKLGNAIMGFTDFNWFLEVVEVPNGGTHPKMQRRLVTAPRPPYYFIKTRGSKFAALLGDGVDVDEVPGGTPTIQGVPAMRYIYNAYRESLGSQKESKP